MGGGALGDHTQGEAIVAGMNLMGYDAMALGSRELSLGPQALGQRMQEAGFPMLSANVVEAGADVLFARPYIVLHEEGHALAVIGLTQMPADEIPGFWVTDPGQALAQVLPEAARQADTVIVLTNLDYASALSLASSIPDVDLIIAAGPDHLPLQAGHAPNTATLVVAAEQPLPKHTGRRVGRLAVTLAGDGSLLEPMWQSVPMSNDMPDDPQMKQLLDGFGK